jgi:FMNH2-dependent dimethyl sulfone monooxygenase
LLVRRLSERIPALGAKSRAGGRLDFRYEWGAARHGRKIDYGMSCHVICADTMDEAHALADQLEEHGKTSRVAFIAAKALGPGLVGTPDTIAERIRRYEAAGVGTLMLHFHPMMAGMERFAQTIMPLVAKTKVSATASA